MAVGNGLQLTYQAFADGLLPDPKFSVSEWANNNIYLPKVDSAEHGKYRYQRTPYVKHILDELGPESRTQFISVMKGAQTGFSTIGNIWLTFIVGYAPGPVIYVLPTLDLAKRTSRQRLQPMFDACPSISGKIREQKAKDASNSVMMKEFSGGMIVLVGSNSASGLRSAPIKYCYLDESSAYEETNEGDASALAIARTTTFSKRRKVFAPSTPTTKGSCRIEREFKKGDQRYYHVVCPHCGDKAPLTWKRMKWDKEFDENNVQIHKPLTAYMICEACGCKIEEHHKTKMMSEEAGAEWVPTAIGEPFHKSYHLSSLYSPLGWFSWGQAVQQFLEAKEAADQGDNSLLKVWTNTVLGETFVSQGTEVSHNHVFNRREHYDVEAPDGVLYVTAGCDVQQDRIEISIFGWGKNQESWCLDHRIIWGDPSNTADPIYGKLDDVLFESRYKRSDGVELPIHCSGIDTGFLATQLYEYIKPRQRRNVFALKGDSGGENAPIVKSARNEKTGRDKRPVNLYMVGTYPTKSLVFSRLLLKNHGAGYIHFPVADWATPEFFEQLTSERIVEKRSKGFTKRSFEKMRPRNEVLDTTSYALATLIIANPNFDLIENYYQAENTEENITEDKPVEQPTQPTKQPRRQQPFRRNNGNKGFIHSWK